MPAKGYKTGVFDSNYAELRVGDTIKDADGHRYTIEPTGRARRTDGSGAIVSIKKLRDPVLESRYVPPVIPDKVASSTPPPPPPDPELLEQEEEKRAADEAAVQELTGPVRPQRGKGGKPNTTGFTSVSRIAAKFGISGHGYSAILKEAGIEVIRRSMKAYIHLEDEVAAYAAFAKAAGKEYQESPGKLPEKPYTVMLPPTVKIPKPFDQVSIHPGNVTLDTCGDADLVEELRRRGWTVTCVKHVEL